MRYDEDDAMRFWWNVKVQKDPTLCWEWKRSLSDGKYGQVTIKQSTLKTHQVAWVLTYGNIPIGKCVLHKCDNMKCCNPNHLFLGTRQTNMQDRDKKKSRRLANELIAGIEITIPYEGRFGPSWGEVSEENPI